MSNVNIRERIHITLIIQEWDNPSPLKKDQRPDRTHQLTGAVIVKQHEANDVRIKRIASAMMMLTESYLRGPDNPENAEVMGRA